MMCRLGDLAHIRRVGLCTLALVGPGCLGWPDYVSPDPDHIAVVYTPTEDYAWITGREDGET